MFKRKIKIIVNILLIVTLIFLTACEKEFSFRGSRFGDSIEQVQKNESNASEIREGEDYKYLDFDDVNNYGDYTSEGSYIFEDDKLILILEQFIYSGYKDDYDKDDVFEKLKEELSKYGAPTEEESGENANKALWEADDFGIVLLVPDVTAVIVYSAYPDRLRESYFDTKGFFTHLKGE